MDPHIEITLPERVPLMIFPAALVFPHTIQPLRIFEHRYRNMLTWALERDRMFCLTQLRPGSTDSTTPEDFYHLAGLGLIRASIEQDDGTPRFWQAGGGFDRNIRDSAEMSRTIRYIHRNPLKRGLVERPEDWAWSSLRWWMGQREGQLPCEYPRGGGWEAWQGYV